VNNLKPLPDVLPDYFWEKIDKGSPDQCWLWQGFVSARGYGTFSLNGKPYRVHRLVLRICSGEDHPHLSACHTCDNPTCCNPAHLYWGNHFDNMRDKIARGRANSLKGVRNPNAKLDPDRVRQIRVLAETVSTTELAKQFAVDRKAIWQVVNRVTWKEV
jgi:hypothetical protein